MLCSYIIKNNIDCIFPLNIYQQKGKYAVLIVSKVLRRLQISAKNVESSSHNSKCDRKMLNVAVTLLQLLKCDCNISKSAIT